MLRSIEYSRVVPNLANTLHHFLHVRIRSLAHILLHRSVLVLWQSRIRSVQLRLNCTEVHRLVNDVGIMRNVECDGIHGSVERDSFASSLDLLDDREQSFALIDGERRSRSERLSIGRLETAGNVDRRCVTVGLRLGVGQRLMICLRRFRLRRFGRGRRRCWRR